MNARELNGMLRFVGGKPMLILRDHTEGRIKIVRSGVWTHTVIPGPVLDKDCDAVLLGVEAEGHHDEERTTWGGVAHALSTFQQTGAVPPMDYLGSELE